MMQIIFPLESNGILEVYNINGLLVDIYAIIGTTAINVPVSNYIHGVYLLIFKNDFKSQSIGKLLKID